MYEIKDIVKAVLENEEYYLNMVEIHETKSSDVYKRLKDAYTELHTAVRNVLVAANEGILYGSTAAKMKINPYITGGAGSSIGGLAGGIAGYTGGVSRNASIDNARLHTQNAHYNIRSSLSSAESCARKISSILCSLEYMKDLIYSSGCDHIKSDYFIEEGIGELEIVRDYKDSAALISSAKQHQKMLAVKKENDKKNTEIKIALIEALLFTLIFFVAFLIAGELAYAILSVIIVFPIGFVTALVQNSK